MYASTCVYKSLSNLFVKGSRKESNSILIYQFFNNRSHDRNRICVYLRSKSNFEAKQAGDCYTGMFNRKR